MRIVNPRRRPSVPRRLARLAARVGSVALLAVVGLLVLAFLIVPAAMGWVPLAVLSGSMRPTLPPGSEIVVRPVTTPGQLDAIGVGEVITFLPHPDDPTLVTHRVVAVQRHSDGSVTFTTKGDANNAPDAHPVAGKQVRGVLAYHAPYLGRLTTLLSHGDRHWGIVAAAAGLIGYGAWQVLSALRSRGNARRGRGRHRDRRRSAAVEAP